MSNNWSFFGDTNLSFMFCEAETWAQVTHVTSPALASPGRCSVHHPRLPRPLVTPDFCVGGLTGEVSPRGFVPILRLADLGRGHGRAPRSWPEAHRPLRAAPAGLQALRPSRSVFQSWSSRTSSWPSNSSFVLPVRAPGPRHCRHTALGSLAVGAVQGSVGCGAASRAPGVPV